MFNFIKNVVCGICSTIWLDLKLIQTGCIYQGIVSKCDFDDIYNLDVENLGCGLKYPSQNGSIDEIIEYLNNNFTYEGNYRCESASYGSLDIMPKCSNCEEAGLCD